MRIPKEINQALNKRAKYYELAVYYGTIVDEMEQQMFQTLGNS